MGLNKEKIEAEVSLFSYLEKKHCSESALLYLRMLFQQIKSGFWSKNKENKIKSIPSVQSLAIDKDNIRKHLYHPQRQPVKIDLLNYSQRESTFYLSEVKSSIDKTAQSPGTTHSCAHRISNYLLNENDQTKLLINTNRNIVCSFLSQSLGYIDAFVNKRELFASYDNLIFVSSIVDNDSSNDDFYAEPYGKIVIDSIKNISSIEIMKQTFYEKKGMNNIVYFEVNVDQVENLCLFLCNEFTQQYFL